MNTFTQVKVYPRVANDPTPYVARGEYLLTIPNESYAIRVPPDQVLLFDVANFVLVADANLTQTTEADANLPPITEADATSPPTTQDNANLPPTTEANANYPPMNIPGQNTMRGGAKRRLSTRKHRSTRRRGSRRNTRR